MKFEKISMQDRIWRGSQPQTATDYQVLQNFGVKYILDLQSGAPWFDDGSPLEENMLAAKYGLTVYNHPLGGILPPTKKELNDGLDVLKNYQPVFVHCRDGVDRTGMMVAWYRMQVQGWSKDTAVSDMMKHGMHFWLYWWSFSL